MSWLDRLLGRGDPNPRQQAQRGAGGFGAAGAEDEDVRAVERYRYLLKTAPPETIEQAHAEAFSRLSPEQRQMVLQELTHDLPEQERSAAAAAGDEPRALARTATRAEMRDPGTLERSFGRFSPAGGIGMGGLLGGTFLSSFAGIMVGTAVANAFFNDAGQDDGSSSGDGTEGAEGSDQAEPATDSGESASSGEIASDPAGDAGGEFGGDFGGGDFGGGDFGGSDF